MSAITMLTVDEVREFIADYPVNNYLIDGKEFSDTRIAFCQTLAINDFNSMSPKTNFTDSTFPSKSVLLYGTLFHMFNGQKALLARNTMNYSDGGLQIPIEERYELYNSMAAQFGQLFQDQAQKLKINLNMENGWGNVKSDESHFPLW